MGSAEPPETGLLAGYHAGTAAASHEPLFFRNEDMRRDSDCLRLRAGRIPLAARICAADPWQWSYDGSERIYGGAKFFRTGWALNSPYPRFAADFNAPLEAGEPVPFPCAGAAMIHRDVYRELGGWDTAFFLDHEDINLLIRAWQRGWKAVQVPGAKVFHAVNASSAQMLTRLNLSVSRRRYVSRRANLTAIAIKYFSWRAVALAALVWPAVVLNNLVRLWGSCLRGDWEVLRELWRRWPWLLAFRRANSAYNRLRRGRDFFRAPEHRLTTRGC